MSRSLECFIAWCLALAVGCDGGDEIVDPLARACDGVRDHSGEAIKTPEDAGIRIDMTSDRVVSPPATGVTVRGTAEHAYGFAIRRLSVAGVAAESDDFNFSRWNAVVPLALLTTLPRDAVSGEIALGVEVRDSCGSYADPASIKVVVDAPELKLDVKYADDVAAYLPVGGSDAATVILEADEAAVGARIRLTTVPEGLRLLDDAGGAVVLQAIDARARATVRVTADSAGSYVLIASSASTSQTRSIVAAGAPTFVPATVMLTPGSIRDVTVLSDGLLRECWAKDVPAGVSVTLDGVDLAKAPASQAGDPTAWTLSIAADMTVMEDSAVTVTCSDHYLQSASLSIAVDG